MRKTRPKNSTQAATQLRLESKRLAFEIRRFDSEKPKRDCELQKLEEEVRELRKAWFRKAAYIGPLSAVLVALFGGLIAFGTNVFKSNVFELYKHQSELKKTRDALQAANRRLLSDQEQLTSKSSALSAANQAAMTQNDALRVTTKLLNTQNSKLVRDVRLAEIRTQVHNLEAVGIYNASEQPFQELLRLTKGRGTPDVVETLENAFEGSARTSVKAALSYALLYATEDKRWKSKLQSACLANIRAGWAHEVSFDGVCPELLNNPLFSIGEKASIIRDLYASYKALPEPRNEFADENRQSFLYALSHWNTAATVKFRDPYFELVGRSIAKAKSSLDLTYSNHPLFPSRDRNEYVPNEALEILILKTVVGPPPTSFDEGYIVGTNMFSDKQGQPCPENMESFPICRDASEAQKNAHMQATRTGSFLFLFFGLHQASASSYGDWVDRHQGLVSAWLDPSFQTLRRCSDQTMEKLVKGVWIDLSDLHPSN